MACKQIEEKCFTFLWKVENISYCLQKKGQSLESPPFVVDAIEGTKWKLRLYPRGRQDGKYIGFFLCRAPDCSGGDKIEIKFGLSFIAKDGTLLNSNFEVKKEFSKGGSWGSPKFQEIDDAFISTRSAFLPEDTLTARCRIWKSVGEMEENLQCISYTRIGVEKRSIQWNVENFSTLEPEKKYTYQMKSIENDSPLMSIDLTLTGALSSEEIVHFDLKLQDISVKFTTYKLCLIDASGNSVECNQDEYWYDSLNKCKQFTFCFTKKKLLAKKSLYLLDDILSLHWEWTFSKGTVLTETQEVRYGAFKSKRIRLEDEKINCEENVSLSHTLKDNLKSFYDNQFLTDVKLKTSTNVFPAHKIILSASSPVFSAMFSNNMKEKNFDFVNIEDLSDDTISRMLLYIYTSNVTDPTWESASYLYAAADKYDIPSLKNICSTFLKENFSSSNACEVLLLSDLHADCSLKAAVQDYILKHDKAIINSEEWSHLMETNAKLAAETLCIRYK